ncbi:hypothetical protein INT44_009228 [Umbelopsis vinacea]|uniref:Yeast cell wall synthesis Kre9/Knh1-like N-terminal domain-containing protein n=1 Tax=Umbelopsis vinacea TaxID=44442 RepID=A0A8H7Q2P8_9FUNG|nr:hypothetical protein INT44_009228 [Umbelopsis vinacea]
MKFISAAAALLAFSVSVVSAADAGILFNSPLTGTVWTAGSTGLLTWTSDDSSITTIPSIDLKQGPSSALQPVLNIGVNVPVSSSPYTWNIPANLPAGNDCELKVTVFYSPLYPFSDAITAGVSPNISYTGTITIQAAAGGAASSGAASSESASASAASSSAPVSSAPATSSAPASTSAAATTAASSAPASSSAAAASSSAAPATTSKSGSNSLKASLVGAGLAAGAAALLL